MLLWIKQIYYATYEMQSYQPIARKYRPQTFGEVIGQEAVVQTLTNALTKNQVGHAYLFCGTRGTGKTSLARILAKALNCISLEGVEPCNQCSSCREITASRSLDVIEIDGASNRGIDDARNITETSIYSPSSGKYKIYIIDEVHMLTKEAFNALLKTLEEPPASVKFFFATTEPHKLPATILSRCQRFDLGRIDPSKIISHLDKISKEMGAHTEIEALQLIARLSQGSLRDAQSMLDQILCFKSSVTKEDVTSALGLLDPSLLQNLDQAICDENLSFAFTFTDAIFQTGKELTDIIDELTSHFREHLHHLLSNKKSSFTKEQLLYILDLFFAVRLKMKPLSRAHFEIVLTKVLRSGKRKPVEYILKQLRETKTINQETVEPAKTEPAKENAELVSVPFSPSQENKPEGNTANDRCHLETLLRFAAVELEGSLKQFTREE
jgi:DNA polymerase III subunit gamma/tau